MVALRALQVRPTREAHNNQPILQRPRLHVHLRLPHPTTADRHRLDTLVAAARPAHMPYTVQVTPTEAAVPAERTSER